MGRAPGNASPFRPGDTPRLPQGRGRGSQKPGRLGQIVPVVDEMAQDVRGVGLDGAAIADEVDHVQAALVALELGDVRLVGAHARRHVGLGQAARFPRVYQAIDERSIERVELVLLAHSTPPVLSGIGRIGIIGRIDLMAAEAQVSGIGTETLTVALCAMLTLTGCKTAETAFDTDCKVGGTAIGAVVGGVAGGLLFGKGQGKFGSALLGAAAGAFVGNQLGALLDCEDQKAVDRAGQQAAEAPVGGKVVWVRAVAAGLAGPPRVDCRRRRPPAGRCRAAPELPRPVPFAGFIDAATRPGPPGGRRPDTAVAPARPPGAAGAGRQRPDRRPARAGRLARGHRDRRRR
ncbi:hypothetical protein MTBUT4_620010 [Magnetospirillum sp. UT-4]|nr:hypothetical protein MTBUT4_620010 [Magnetospirillum sp. UT-4]